MKDLTGSGH